MCNDLIKHGIKYLHFYTINLETAVVEAVNQLGIMRKDKKLPWKKPSIECRSDETVRPIFWANKPNSYIARTAEWDEYPNGRWGVSRSPAFGNMGDYPSMSKLYKKSKKQLQKLWGENYDSERDIGNLIISYIQGRTKRLPWCEEHIQSETSTISKFIESLNMNYLFTVNSQPKCNSVPSSDPVFGWGPEGGYVYQKEYIEFLIPKVLVELLRECLDQHKYISYQGVNSRGDKFSNVSINNVNAVTWGVFPCQEVAQPTVVDHTAFYLWSEELFETIKDDWLIIYPKDSKTHEVLTSLHDNYYLVNVVDNDFINGKLQEIMITFIKENQESIDDYESVIPVLN
jgi:methylenetetrahydrofolate reductase (NADPH)